MDLFGKNKKSFAGAILQAVKECSTSAEEEGGVILVKDGEYMFVRVKNIHHGKDIAGGLYEADREELAEKVISKFSEGWRMGASFHTHPTFPATPSSLDLSKLFNSFNQNVIFSPCTNTFSYSQWLDNYSAVCYLPFKTVEALSNQN